MLDKKELSQLHRVSLAKYVSVIALNWTIIFALIWFAMRVDHLLAYMITIIAIGGRQHALFVLLHEQVHRNFTKRVVFGDIISNFFCGYPLGINTNRYRVQHMPHHYHPNSPKDPYWHIFNNFETWKKPKSKKSFIRVLIKDFLGLNGRDTMNLLKPWHIMTNHFSKEEKNGVPSLKLSERITFYVFLLTVVSVILAFNPWQGIVLWSLAQMTVLNIFMRLRAMSEHPFVEIESNDRQSQMIYSNTVVPGFIESLFFAPYGAGHHTLHHLYPSMPTFNFKKAHKKMMGDDNYRKNTTVYNGYLLGKHSVFKSLVQQNEKRKGQQENAINVAEAC